MHNMVAVVVHCPADASNTQSQPPGWAYRVILSLGNIVFYGNCSPLIARWPPRCNRLQRTAVGINQISKAEGRSFFVDASTPGKSIAPTGLVRHQLHIVTCRCQQST